MIVSRCLGDKQFDILTPCSYGPIGYGQPSMAELYRATIYRKHRTMTLLPVLFVQSGLQLDC